MKIQVLGSGCQTCKQFFETTKQAVKELGLKDKVEYITDISKIIQMGIMSSPVLVVDDKPVLIGCLPNLEKIKQAISSGSLIGSQPNKGKCGCGGNC